MPTLQADLDLQIEEALSNLGQLDDALGTSASNFSQALTEGISSAFDAASTFSLEAPIVLEPDASGVEPAIAEAVAGAADQLVLPLTADPTEAEAAIHDVGTTAEGQAAVISVTADTGDAEQAISDVGSSAEDAQSQIGGLTTETQNYSGASAEAASSSAELAGGVGGFAAKATTGIVGALGLAVGIHSLIDGGLEATGVQQRYNSLLGEFATQVEHVHVGNLNTSLEDLGHQLGDTETNLKQTNTNLFQFARNSGSSGDEAATFAGRITALSARAVALNPALGSVGDVADSMGVRIARGGRFAASFGLSLTAAEINARALADTGKSAASDLTLYEKATAAAALATDKYGGSLKQTVEEGSKNAILQQRSLTASFKETVEALGKPLVSPFLEALSAAIPLATVLGRLFADFAVAILPPLTAALQVVVIPLQIIADVLELIPAPLLSVVAGFFAFQKIIGGTSGLLTKFGAEGLGAGLKSNAVTAAAAILAVATAVQVLSQKAAPTTAQTLSLGASFAALGFQLGGVQGAAIGAAVGIGVGLVKGIFAAGESADDTRKRLAQLGTELDKLGKKDASEKFLQNFVDNALDGKVKSLNDELEKLAESSPAAAQKVIAGLRGMRDESGKLQFPKKALDEYEESVRKGSETHLKYSEEQKKAEATNKKFEASTEASTTALDAQKAAEDEAKKSLDNLVSAAQSSLPGVSSAFDSAAQNAQQLAQTVASAMPTASSSFDSTKQAAESFGASLTPELLLGGLQQSLTQTGTFLDNVQVLLDGGFTNIAGLLASKGPEVGGQLAQSLADGIRNGDPTITQELDVTAGILEAGGKAAADKFGNAFTPATLLKSFEESLTATANFTANLQTLMDSGLSSLAGLLIQKGPELGGSLAQQLADGIRNGDPAVAQALDDKASLLETAAVVYGDTVRDKWGPEILSAQNTAFGALAPAAAEKLGLVRDSVATAGPIISAEEKRQAEAAAASFGFGLAPIPGHAAEAMNQAGESLLGAAPGAADKAKTGGESVTSKWGEGLGGVPGAAGDAVDKASGPLGTSAAGLAAQGGAAFEAGFVVGEAFSAGLITGMAVLLSDIIETARTLVSAAELAARREARASSPSKLFAELGGDMGDGLVVGMAGTLDKQTSAGAGLVLAASTGTQSVALAVPSIRSAASSSGAVAAPAAAGGVLPQTAAAGALIGQQVNNFHVPVPDPFAATREQGEATRHAMFLAGVL